MIDNPKEVNKEKLILGIIMMKDRKDRRKLARKLKIPWECIMTLKKHYNIK